MFNSMSLLVLPAKIQFVIGAISIRRCFFFGGGLSAVSLAVI